MEKDNLLIAEFMEVPKCQLQCKDNCGSYNFPVFGYHPVKDMKYHTSWDWLMPVVEKIESLGYMFSISEKEAFTCHNENNTDGDFECVSKSKIASAHYVAVKFITWYNLKQPPIT